MNFRLKPRGGSVVAGLTGGLGYDDPLETGMDLLLITSTASLPNKL